MDNYAQVYEEIRKLKDEIASLTQVKETKAREAKDAIEFVEDLGNQKNILEKALRDLDNMCKDAVEKTKIVIKECHSIINDSTDLVKEHAEDLKKMLDYTHSSTSVLVDLIKTHNESSEQLGKEQADLLVLKDQIESVRDEIEQVIKE